MKAIKLKCTLLLAALFAVVILPLQAQQNDKADDQNKVVTIKKYIDDDGVEVTEKIVTDGAKDCDMKFSDSIDDMDFDFDFNFDFDHDIDVDVDETEGQKVIRIRTSKDGEVETFEWEGTGEMPKEVQEKLDKMKAMHHGQGRSFHVEGRKNRPFLGVVMGKKVTNINGEETVEGESPLGVVISEVVEGSAAEAAGLMDNDIITAIDGKKMTSHSDVSRAIRAKNPGDQMTISYLRNDQSATTTATLKERKRKIKSYGYSHAPHWRGHNSWFSEDRPCVFIGVYVKSSADADHKNNGARVTGIIHDTPAQDAGLQKGDIITALAGVPVNTYGELLTERNKHNPGDQVTVNILRNGEPIQVDVTFRECEEKQRKVIIIKEQKEDKATSEEDVPGEDLVIDQPVELPATLELENFRAFPNPTYNEFTVRFKGAAVPTTISVVDVTGREIYREELPNFDGAYDRLIDAKDAARGALLVNVIQDDKIFTEKIILLDRA